MDSDSECSSTHDDSNEAKNVTHNSIPEKSKVKYEKRYDLFMDWCKGRGIKTLSEDVLLAYLTEQSKVRKPATLWGIYSMLKTTLKVKNDIDICCYKKVTDFLKRLNLGYKPTKAKTFSKEQIDRFLTNAPDEKYLLNKVVMILGISGACRLEELLKMTVNDIEDLGSRLIVTIPETKTNKGRLFTVTNGSQNVDYLFYCREYLNLRPKITTSPRLFLNYRNGRCNNVCCGRNNLAKIPMQVAQYLKIPNPNLYTGRSLRRTSATLLGYAGGSISQLRNREAGGWRSTTFEEDDSATNKIETTNKILNQAGGNVSSKKQFTVSTTQQFQPDLNNAVSTSGTDFQHHEGSITRVTNDVDSQWDLNSTTPAMFRTSKSSVNTKVEPHETAEFSNTEIQACASSSKMRFETPEVHFENPDLGAFDESGMCLFDPSNFLETSLQSNNVDKTKEKEVKKYEEQLNSDASDLVSTLATNDSNATDDEVAVIESINNTKSASVESASAKPAVTEFAIAKLAKDINSTNATPLKSNKQVEAPKKVERHSLEGIMSQNKLDSIIDRLECVSTKFESVAKKIAVNSLVDRYDEFGKYLSSLLRGLPTKKVNALKNKILTEVLEALYEEEREAVGDTNKKSVGTQVGPDVTSEKSYKQSKKEQTQTGKSVASTDKPSLSKNIPILSKNMPILFPSASNSTYQLLPANSSSSVCSATMVATTSGSMMSVPPVTLTPSETITTITTSPEETLLAVTIPKPQITEPPVGSSNPPSQAPRGQKRKQPTDAHLIMKQNTKGRTQSEDKTCRARRVGEEFDTAVRPRKSNEDEEDEMDIEDENELAEIKKDQEYFETVFCGQGSEIYIKEEEPDPDPDDNTSSTPTEPLLCSLCGAHCNDKGQLASHFSTAHPGYDPGIRRISEGGYFGT